MSLGAHIYWAVFLGRGNPNVRAAIAEVEMRGSIGGANLCIGGTPTGPGGTSANAYDGNSSTWWESTSEQLPLRAPRIGYQFASPVEIAEVVLTNNSNSSMLSSYGVLAWSDDGTTYTPVSPAFALSPAASGSVTVSGFEVEASVGSAGHDGSVVLFGDWAALSPDDPGVVASGSAATADPHGGQCHVAGDVAIAGTPDAPVSRRVRLFDKASGALMRELWSDAVSGAYDFVNIRDGAVIVTAEDHTAIYNAVVSDAVLPVPM